MISPLLIQTFTPIRPEGVHLHTGLADHDPGPGGVDVDRDPLRVLADQDVREPGVRELPVDVLADLDVLEQVGGKVLRAGVPVRLPVVDDADAHPAGMNLLTHYVAASSGSSSIGSIGSASTTGASRIVMWQVGVGLPAARA